MGRLDGKVAVITGAGSGMGRASAELFAEEGAKVVCADRSGDETEVARDIGDAALAVHADVSVEADVEQMIGTAEARFGRLDVLFNNAGFGGPTMPLHEQTLETWDLVHGTNLRGVFLGIKHGVPAMLRSGGGSIVNTASAAGLVGWKGHSVYGAAKAGVIQLTKVAALDYADDNIRVNAICPGMFWTGLVKGARDSGTVGQAPPSGAYPPPAGVPMGRWGRASEVATAALFFASDDSSFVTGVALPVDGGFVCP
ncbi:MAG TPA: SDR family oxidoreductase [Acidimicrobiia bacterium]|jgi:NAD(P)-dependent dehydrogenase (short-subunit alcohol dehydrogenase family)